MIIPKNKGQEAIEFILITALVFFAAIFTVSIFGNKIAAFFTSDSAIAKTASQTTNTLNTTQDTKYNPDYDTVASNDTPSFLGPPPAPVTTIQIDGYNVTENADGSLSLMVGNQNITLPANAVALQETVMESTGSSGWKNLITEVAYMIEKHKADYPGDVPIELFFGNGNRNISFPGTTASYTGNTVANSTAIIIGNDVVIIQNDQECTGTGNKCLFEGEYRIEGTIDSSNNFTGYVTSNTGYNSRGNYTAQIDTTNGFNLVDSLYKQKDNYNSKIMNYNWDINFDNPDYQFSLTDLATQ